MITFENLKIYKTTKKYGQVKNGKFESFKEPKMVTVLVHDFSEDYVDVERLIGFLVSNKIEMIEDKYKMECEINISI